MVCKGCSKQIDQKSLQRWEGVTVCQKCRSNPKVYYYERLLRAALGLDARPKGSPKLYGATPTGYEAVFMVVKDYLPFHLYWDTKTNVARLSKEEIIEYYNTLRVIKQQASPYKLVRWYAHAHDHPPTPE